MGGATTVEEAEARGGRRPQAQDAGNDSWLGNLDVLLIMDDNALLATIREQLIRKFKIVHGFCLEYGMVITID